MRNLGRFWRTLERFPGCSAAELEWKRSLGEEFALVARFLRRTGETVSSVWCPSPWGEYCPRRVIRHADGSIVAVCGEAPRRCDSLGLTRSDIAVRALDVHQLAAELCPVLGIQPGLTAVNVLPRTFRLGTHFAAAGCGFPVHLSIQSEHDRLSAVIARINLTRERPTALLLPSLGLIDPALGTIAHLSRITLVDLSECVLATEAGRLTVVPGPEEIFGSARAAIMPVEVGLGRQRAWILPPDARWQQLTIDFIEEEVIQIHFGGATKRLEPEHLGMKSRKNGRPTVQWTLLQAMAKRGGRLPRRDARDWARITKQKQELSGKLKGTFGIEDDPIVWDDGARAYVTRFILRASGLRPQAGDKPRPPRAPLRRPGR